jgi:N-acetylglucosaminyldiphosphoundecaprenol N-acetyl-beta-D-mannosaminyltransferase
MLIKRTILSSSVSIGKYTEFIEAICGMSVARQSSYVCFANAHTLITAHQEPAFASVVNNADIVAPDGKPVSVLMHASYSEKQDRVCGMDMLPDLLKACADKGLAVYFYGSTPEVLQQIHEKARTDFPALKIAGQYSPPFRALTPSEDEEIVTMINHAAPSLIFVSLGCPKQETWMHHHKGLINGCMLGVGQAFLTYAGLEKRLPQWARSLSLEWLYRLYLEPKRLWKRYLIGNTQFIIAASRWMLTTKLQQLI